MNTMCNKVMCIRGYKYALDAKVQLYIFFVQVHCAAAAAVAAAYKLMNTVAKTSTAALSISKRTLARKHKVIIS